MKELHAANGPDLKAQAAAGFGTMLPFLRDPPEQMMLFNYYVITKRKTVIEKVFKSLQ